MIKFRNKPVVIEAVLWQPDQECWENELGALYAGSESVAFWNLDGTLSVETPEGRITAQPGDWIIKGTKGDFCACKADIFAAIYEAVDHPEAGDGCGARHRAEPAPNPIPNPD